MASPSSPTQFNTEKLGMPLIRIRDISKTDAEAYFEGDYDPAYVVRGGRLSGRNGWAILTFAAGKERVAY